MFQDICVRHGFLPPQKKFILRFNVPLLGPVIAQLRIITLNMREFNF